MGVNIAKEKDETNKRKLVVDRQSIFFPCNWNRRYIEIRKFKEGEIRYPANSSAVQHVHGEVWTTQSKEIAHTRISNK